MKKIVYFIFLIAFSVTVFAAGEVTELTERTMKITVPSFTLTFNDENDKPLKAINDTLYSDSFALLNDSEDTSEGFSGWDKSVYISEATMTSQNEKTVSFTTTQYVYYYHAAHGMHLLLGYVFDPATGEKLTLADLLTGTDYRTRIFDFMQKEIKEKEIPIFDDVEFKGIDENTEFYLKDDQLVFVFQEYEYTPYYYGFLTFEVPLDDLKDDLNPKYF